MKQCTIIAALCLWVFVAQAQVPEQTGSSVSKAEAQLALDFHNKARKDVNVPPLTWSTTLAAYAQAWADELKAKECNVHHRPNNNYGENIFWGLGADYDALGASESWYSEIEFYHGEVLDTKNYQEFGHYTQMVWKNSLEVGIGKSTCSDGTIIIVGNYSPAGNFIGRKAY
jgi:pathogenesis-related protein 1